jgi:hypothetical protein
MPAARSKPPVLPNTALLNRHNANALPLGAPSEADGTPERRNSRLRIGRRAYSDRLFVDGLLVRASAIEKYMEKR